MELKSRKNVLCLIVVGLLDLCTMDNQMLWVWRGEGCLVIYKFAELVASFKAKKRKVNVGAHGFEFYLCLSFSQLEFWSADCLRLSFELSPPRLVFYIWSDCFFCFLPRRSPFGRKIIFIFFWQISLTFPYVLILCVETPFFPFWRKSQHR